MQSAKAISCLGAMTRARACLGSPALSDEVRILSAPLLGSWNINLKSKNPFLPSGPNIFSFPEAGIKLNMQALCEFLQQSMFEDRVYKVQFVAQKGNSSRFNNLSLYIRTSCLLTWKKDDDLDNHQDNVYVNVYESGVTILFLFFQSHRSLPGKCSVLAVPDTEVAEELADVVSGMLYEALRQQVMALCTVLNLLNALQPGISEEIQSTKRRKL
eukprot:747479-Hanusia_phi.AAC.4